jgi:hypothetical protein
MSNQLEIPKCVKLLWNSASIFVRRMCNGRDDSHGHPHMKKVAYNALEIFINEYPNYETTDELKFNLSIVIICAWLHDVPDHKYDPDGTLIPHIIDFLETIYDGNTQLQQVFLFLDTCCNFNLILSSLFFTILHNSDHNNVSFIFKILSLVIGLVELVIVFVEIKLIS